MHMPTAQQLTTLRMRSSTGMRSGHYSQKVVLSFDANKRSWNFDFALEILSAS